MSNAERPKGGSKPRPGASRVSAARSGGPQTKLIVAVVVGVVVVAGLIAVVFARGSTSDTSSASTSDGSAVAVPEECGGGTAGAGGELSPYQPVEVAGDPLAEFPGSDQTDPALGQQAPKLTGKTFDGAAISAPCTGRPTLVIFLAHWCPHCQREVPALAQYWADHGAPKGIDVVSVASSTDADRPNFPPQDWLTREDWPAPTMADDKQSTAARAYGLSSFPYFVLVSADGKVLLRSSGEIDPATLDATLARLVPDAGGAGA